MKKINLQLLIGEAKHQSNTKISFPIHAPEVVRLNTSSKQLATQVYSSIHKNLLMQGEYKSLLNYILSSELQHEVIEVSIKASKEHLYPELHLNFDMFYFKNDKEQWVAYIPILSIESTGKDLESLKEHIKDNIQLEFIRRKRINAIPAILSSQWFSDVSIEAVPMGFHFYTLNEQEKFMNAQKQQLLPQIATRMQAKEELLFGLKKEMEQVLNSMKTQYRSSVLICADSGKGKTALIEEFCRIKAEHGLTKTNIWEVSAAQLLHRLSGLGSWEEYLGDLCRELRQTGDILYITNFAELFEVGQYVGNNMSIADYLRDYIARGEIIIISECTPTQLSRIEFRSPGYIPLFSVISIEELSNDAIKEIVIQKVNSRAEKKSCLIDDDAIIETLRLQQWYTPYSGLPGKTIHFLDAILSDKQKKEIKVIDKGDIYEKFCQETGIPEFMINPNINLDIEEMIQFFQSNIYGQEDAIQTVTDILVSIKAAVIRRGQPLASLLFVGPTGVGKTEMAKILAQFMFGSRDKMIRFDMSEYSDMYSVLRLTGDTSSGEGLLTSAVRQQPFSVLLFDELEKVDPTFYDLLLQILGEGRLTDAYGRVADFSSTIIIMTSNIGARSFQTGSIGFVESKNEKKDASAHFKKSVQTHFRPELFNRIDRVIAFAPLEQQIVGNILNRELGLIKKREGIKGRNIQLNANQEVLDYLSVKGYNANYGARFLQRTLQEQLIVPLAERLNSYPFDTPLEISLILDQQHLDFKIQKREDINIAEQKINDNSELSIIDFINQLSLMRRSTRVIENGSYYTKFLSRLDQLERKLKKMQKRKIDDQFWKLEELRKPYYELTEIQTQFDSLLKEIQDIESEVFLLLNHIGSNSSEYYQKYVSWNTNFKQIKSRIVKTENPEFQICSVGIYGNGEHLLDIYRVYQQLFTAFSFEYSPMNVWFNNANGKYERKSLEDDKITADLKLAGIEIEVKGELPYLYLKKEHGYHFWMKEDGKYVRYMINVVPSSLEKYNTPGGVHRKNFFTNKTARRQYKLDGLKDFEYHIHTEHSNYSVALEPVLKMAFDRNVDSYLFD